MPRPIMPVLTRYEGQRLHEVAFPLGGIGTGTVALGGRAELRDFELFNRPSKGCNPPCTFFAIRVQLEGEPAVTRILEGTFHPPYSGAFGVGAAGAGLPRMRHVALEAAYPFARYILSDPDVPLQVNLEAFTPLVPLNVRQSSLPLAVLRYVLTNTRKQAVDAAVSGSLLNFIGIAGLSCCEENPTITPGCLGKLMGGNVNELRSATAADGTPLRGLLMRSERVPAGSSQDGTLALVALTKNVTCRRTWGPVQWNRHLLTFWDDFGDDGRFDDPAEVAPSPEGQGQVGSVGVTARIEAEEEAVITFLLCWHFAHRTVADWGWEKQAAKAVGNYYAHHFDDAWDVAVQVVPRLEEMEEASLRFVRAFVASDLPQPVKEAALNNLSTLRSQTCFRTADGDFFGYEGCSDTRGCCFGSCTHVWNYEQATPFLFPELARNMRRLELEKGTLENGMNCFRLHFPARGEPFPHAAADGQMGVVIKCYREWQLSGDDGFLQRYWPTIKSLVSFCWLKGGWDADRDGVMEGIQHNTYDVEFYGPNPLTGVWYLAALRAAEEMAQVVGDEEFARQCHKLFHRGSKWIDKHLFNGEYYVQEISTPKRLEDTMPELHVGMGQTSLDEPDFQLGTGCLVDQLVGQYAAHVVGLGHLLDAENILTALQSLFRYNFCQDLYDHWNTMRTYALADESALLICTWPRGERPRVPFPYFSEVMTGFEYQAAAHMIYEGMVEEGLRVIAAVRDRFDGHRRNPWNEQECGHHYARAMASWAAVLALSGFRYSAVTGLLQLMPRRRPEAFQCFWVVPTGWGAVYQTIAGGEQLVRWEVLSGELGATRMRYALPEGKTLDSVTLEIGSRLQAAETTENAGIVDIVPAVPVQAAAGRPIVVHIRY